MKIQGLVRNAENLEWSNDASPEIAKHCKNTRWKTIFSSGDTATNKLVLGFCEILEGGYLGLHHHLEAEIYYILKGEGIVSINGKEVVCKTHDSIFLPSNAEHGISNKGNTSLEFIYAFNANSFADVEYIFKN